MSLRNGMLDCFVSISSFISIRPTPTAGNLASTTSMFATSTKIDESRWDLIDRWWTQFNNISLISLHRGVRRIPNRKTKAQQRESRCRNGARFWTTSQRHRGSAVRSSNRALPYAPMSWALNIWSGVERNRATGRNEGVASRRARSALIMTYDHSTGHYSLEKRARILRRRSILNRRAGDELCPLSCHESPLISRAHARAASRRIGAI